jgi:ribonuclease inhibitor
MAWLSRNKERVMSKEYVLDCENMTDRERAHEYIAEELDFPDYYGKNLDALFDCLTEMEECSILFINLDALEMLGDYSGAMLAVFEEAEQANEDLTIIYDSMDDDDFYE